jgi:adhesin transport system outer membrane protein
LIECLGVQMPAAAAGTERRRFRVNPIPPGDLQENSVPYPAMITPAAAPAATTPGAAAAVAQPTEQPQGR